MPRKPKLYLDTSVPNAYFDEKNPYRQEITRQFWLKLKEYQVFISDLVVKNPGPEDLALIYPQRGFVLPVISVFFGIME